MIGAGEQDATPDHLAHDASDWPDVDVLLVAHAEDDLGRPVVPRHDVRRHHEGRAGRPRQPEVQDLQGAVGLHHDIARLQILRERGVIDYNFAQIYLFFFLVWWGLRGMYIHIMFVLNIEFAIKINSLCFSSVEQTIFRKYLR